MNGRRAKVLREFATAVVGSARSVPTGGGRGRGIPFVWQGWRRAYRAAKRELRGEPVGRIRAAAEAARQARARLRAEAAEGRRG